MKTLQDVAKTFASLAYRNVSTPGLQTYAVDTGNLKDKVKGFNTIDKMITQRKSKSPTKLSAEAGTVAYQFAPPGAKYGKWVEWGTRNMKPRPFAGDAATDPELQKVIQEYQLSLTAQVGAQAANQVSKSVAKMSARAKNK